jgi:hypothetical protein
MFFLKGLETWKSNSKVLASFKALDVATSHCGSQKARSKMRE